MSSQQPPQPGNEGYPPVYEDDELEILMAGGAAGQSQLDGDPMAGFFFEVRSLPASPRPNAELAGLFEAGLAGPASAASPGPSPAEPIGPEPVAPTMAMAPDPAFEPTGRQPVADDGLTLAAPDAFPEPGGPLQGPIRISGSFPDAPPAAYDDVLSVGRAPTVYRSSTFETVLGVLRPNGTKLLVLVSVLLVGLAAGQAFGLVSLPGLGADGTGDQTLAGATPTQVGDGGDPASPSTEDESDRFGAGGESTSSSVTVATTGSTTGDDPSPSTTRPATTTPTVETTTTTEAETTTTEAETTTTTEAETTTTTEAETTTTTEAETTTTTEAETTTTTEAETTTTQSTVVVPRLVTINRNAPFVVGDDEGGRYVSTGSANGECVVEINDAPRTYTDGAVVSFTVAVGDVVIVDEGCPRRYLVS